VTKIIAIIVMILIPLCCADLNVQQKKAAA